MIGIRVDGNKTLGSGHIMRCLAIAKQLQKLGSKPVFFGAEQSEWVQQAGFVSVAVGGSYKDISNECILPHLEKHGICTLLIDSYYTTSQYHQKIMHSGVHTAVLFDMGNGDIPCDLLINYNINYPDFLFRNAKKSMLGPTYAPLRQEFSGGCKQRDYSSAKSLLLTLGGADPAGATAPLVKALCNEPKLKQLAIRVVVGGMNPQADEIQQLSQQYKNVQILHNVDHMAKLMCESDLCISAGGTTLYEICACGLPCIVFSIADNQDAMIEAMQQQNIMRSAGVYRHGKQQCLQNVVEQTMLLQNNQALREELSQNATNLVDGRGAEKIAQELLLL